MKKYLKFYCLLALSVIFIININSISHAMTSDDFDNFVRQGTMYVTYELGNDITNFNVDLGSIYKFINTNYWTNEKSNVPFGSYDCLEVRATEDSNYRYIGIFMWNYATVNINFTATNMNRVDSIMGAMCHIAPVTQVNNVRYINYAINRNSSTNEDWTKTDYGDTGTLWTNPTQNNANTMYLIKNPILNINNYKYVGYNIYNKIQVEDSIEIHGIEDIANVRVGSYWATGDITYRLYYMNLDQKVYIDWDYEVQYDTFETYNGRLGTLIAVNIRQNIENNTCYIEMIKNDIQEICTSNIFYLKNVVEQPVINGSSGQYNASGELVGSIDLSNITEQLQQNESGDERRFNIFKEMFNGLFTLSSGDVEYFKTRMNTIIGGTQLGIAEIEGEMLEELTEYEPNDFKLEWQQVNYNGIKLIPSGDINFSKWTRDNQTLQRVHGITRIVIIGALSIIIIRAIWKFIAISFGIGMEMYEENQEENEIIESTHDTIDYSTGEVTRGTTYRKGRNTLTTIEKMKRKL